MKKIFKVTLIIILVLVICIASVAVYVKKALPDVGAPENISIASTPEKVERGRYLATNVMVCMDCHSQRDFSYYAGPPKSGNLGGGGEHFSREMGLPGSIYSRNLTPYALKDWT